MTTFLEATEFSTAARAGTRTTLGITDIVGGTVMFNGAGAQTVLTIAHGLGVIPTRRSVDAGSAAAAFYVTADATTLTVTITDGHPVARSRNSAGYFFGAATMPIFPSRLDALHRTRRATTTCSGASLNWRKPTTRSARSRLHEPGDPS